MRTGYFIADGRFGATVKKLAVDSIAIGGRQIAARMAPHSMRPAKPNEPFYLIRREMPAELAQQNPKKLRSLSPQRRSSPSDITATG